MNLQALVLLDISSILLMVVLAYLSKRLGDAMKIGSFFKILYITSIIIICASGIDFIAVYFNNQLFPLLTLSLRFIAGLAAFIVCMIYWKWLFSAFKN
jgi:chromate transport protein ChrA